MHQFSYERSKDISRAAARDCVSAFTLQRPTPAVNIQLTGGRGPEDEINTYQVMHRDRDDESVVSNLPPFELFRDPSIESGI
jgi:hypothetical protein